MGGALNIINFENQAPEMNLRNWHKITLLIISVAGIIALIYYFNLSNRHKAIVKTRALHFCKLIDASWEKSVSNNEIIIESPSFLIDGIYKSMEGPKAMQYFNVNSKNNELLWMTGFEVKAIHTKSGNSISNDFICHMNIDYLEEEHHGKWRLDHRINRQYPRAISLSHGVECIKFPEGYGFPMFSYEPFFLTTQSLNHNVQDSVFQVKHEIHIAYSMDKNIKPLRPKNIFMMLPFDKEHPEEMMVSDVDACIPVETKNHTYYDDNGQALSGHWKIFPGKQTFTCNVTQQLAVRDTVRVHQITPHLHPLAENFQLKDLTSGDIIYNCEVVNHNNTIGLTKTPVFLSQEGMLLYPTHQYELKLTTNNTTEENQDMMASMFLFFYDEEMDAKVNTYYDDL